YGSPVAYLCGDDFNKELLRVVRNIGERCDFLRTVPRENQVAAIVNMLTFAAACTKHPGFAEEREWRIIYLPRMQESKVLERSVETINGVPQTVYKIPLKDFPEEGLTGIELPSLVERVIVGPSLYPWPLYEAFVSVLKDAGVEKAEEKVITSD